jgi:hypothetical protein
MLINQLNLVSGKARMHRIIWNANEAITRHAHGALTNLFIFRDCAQGFPSSLRCKERLLSMSESGQSRHVVRVAATSA